MAPYECICEVGICHRFLYESGPFFPGGEKIYWPEMPRKSFLGGTVLLTDFSKNIPGGRDLRGINLRPHRTERQCGGSLQFGLDSNFSILYLTVHKDHNASSEFSGVS